MRDVAIIGWGMTAFGRLRERSLPDLAVEAALDALDAAGAARPDRICVGCMLGGRLAGQAHLGAVLADQLGACPAPAMRIEAGGASGALALRAAWLEVASGSAEVALAVGVEKMSERPIGEVLSATSSTLDRSLEADVGITPAAAFALVAREHMQRYATTREHLSAVAVKNHANAIHNPRAHVRRALQAAAASDSPLVADPLRAADCSPISDGAAAVVLAPVEAVGGRAGAPPIRIAAIGCATDRLALHQRTDLARFAATARAAESLGFFEPGQAGPAIADGRAGVDGRLPINTSGGLLAQGNPIGAAGVAQIAMLVRQLRGDAGPVQVKNARRGLAHSMGGCDATGVVTILEALE